MASLLSDLLAGGPVLTDGAWGTELQLKGLGAGDLPDLWNLAFPERVAEVARSYVEAGSRVILTNTFSSNRLRLQGHARAELVRELNREGVKISKQAAQGKAAVFASLGPSGRMLFSGETSEEELQSCFTEQAQALAEAGADGIVVETMGELEEARLAVAAAHATGLPVVACMVFDSGKNRDRTMMGTTPEQAVAVLDQAGADVIGANCGVGIEYYLPVCQRLRAASDKPVWVKGNAGLPSMVDGRTVYHTTPEEFAAHIPRLIAAGASFVGGCCGTSPRFIQAVRAILSK
jgi:5-methyltetrahydrofolate--homocysteine methyltransferase